jgi:hypothetical protein
MKNTEATLASAFRVNQKVPGFRKPNLSSPARTRTSDKAVNSRLLYQLSYRGMGRRESRIGTLKSILTPARGQGHERLCESQKARRIASQL